MTTRPHAVDVRRRAGWLPEDQDDLEAWLDGHGEREGKGEQVVLRPVLTKFQELIDADPVVRMYINQMIAQVPGSKPYRKRHLESVEQMLRMINEVLTMAPEFGAHMVATPGYQVEKGEELGYFQYGGSTHCPSFVRARSPSLPSRRFPSRTTPTRR